MGVAFINDLTDTWSSGVTTYQSIKMTVTDTTSCNLSKYVEFTGSTGDAHIDKFGYFNGETSHNYHCRIACACCVGIGSAEVHASNTFFGLAALNRIQHPACSFTGCYNTAYGTRGMWCYTGSCYNSSFGSCVQSSSCTPTTGLNTAMGNQSGCGLTLNCNFYTAAGYAAMHNPKANELVGIGRGAAGQPTAVGTIGIGLNAQDGGASNTLPSIMIGEQAGTNMTTAHSHIGIGKSVFCQEYSGNNTVAIGQSAATTNANSCAHIDSVYVGYTAGLRQNGSDNVGVGVKADCAGFQMCSCCNTYIGYNAGQRAGRGYITINNEIAIGYNSCPNTSVNNHTSWGNSSNNACNCVYTSWSTVSDCRDKTCIKNLPENYGLTFINKLKPKKFKWDNRSTYAHECNFEYGCKDGTLKGKKFNYGFIAQDVKETIDDLGISFDALGYSKDNDGYRLTYTELISPLTLAVQQLACRIDALED